MWASSARKVLTFVSNALNFLNILQVAQKYSNKVMWGGEGRGVNPGHVKPIGFTPSIDVSLVKPGHKL